MVRTASARPTRGRVAVAGRSLVAVMVLLWSGAALAQSAAPAAGAPSEGTEELELRGFVRAIDGNTVDTRIEPGGRIGIDIIGIEAPPGNTPCGRRARDYLQRLVSGGDGVWAVEEPGLTSDQGSRRRYHLTTGDGRSISEEMVAAGFARADGQGSNRETLAELEATARAEHRGCLWAAGGTP